MENNSNQANSVIPTPLSPNNDTNHSTIENPQGNKFIKFLFYVAGAILFMVIGALALSLYQGQNTKVSEENLAEPSKTIIATPSAEATPTTTTQSNTKLYSNTELGYSVQIPTNWDTEGKGSFVNIPGEITFLPPGEKSKEAYRTVIAITKMTTDKIRYSLNTQPQFNEWMAKPISDGRGERLYKIANIKVDGIDSVQFINRALPGDQTEAFYSIVTWFRKDNANYYIEFGGVESIINNHRSVYDQVVSSFKFE